MTFGAAAPGGGGFGGMGGLGGMMGGMGGGFPGMEAMMNDPRVRLPSVPSCSFPIARPHAC
jgi:hypothetical protein